MARALVILDSPFNRGKAARWAQQLPAGTRVEFREPKRSIPQNDRFWATLTDIAAQSRYHGLKLAPEDWKLLFLDALKREVRIVPNLDGTGFVNLSRSSSELSKQEFSELLEIIHAWCAREGVELSSADGRERAA